MNQNKIHVIVFDTTSRDGEQSPRASMNLVETLRIAHAREDHGIDAIEAGFAIASSGCANLNKLPLRREKSTSAFSA